MEKYYDGDQDTFFRNAHVINPFNKPNIITKPKVSQQTSPSYMQLQLIYIFQSFVSICRQKDLVLKNAKSVSRISRPA